ESTRAWMAGRDVAEDGGPRRTREPQPDQPLHHVAAAEPDLSVGAALPGRADPNHPPALPRCGVSDGGPACFLPVPRPRARRVRVGSADRPGAGGVPAAHDLRSRVRARIFPLRAAHRAAMAPAARTRAGSAMGRGAREAGAVAGTRWVVSARRVGTVVLVPGHERCLLARPFRPAMPQPRPPLPARRSGTAARRGCRPGDDAADAGRRAGALG